MAPDPTRSASDFWEEHYSGVDRVWSGNVNTALREVAGDLPPGRALDLGSAEGADSMWLAQRGWTVTGVEVSPTAVERATAAVQQAGIEPGRVEFVVADLEDYEFDGPYDLIVAAFLQSPLNFKRERVLAAAARAVEAGGRILIIAHASIPPWAVEEHSGDVGLTRNSRTSNSPVMPGRSRCAGSGPARRPDRTARRPNWTIPSSSPSGWAPDPVLSRTARHWASAELSAWGRSASSVPCR